MGCVSGQRVAGDFLGRGENGIARRLRAGTVMVNGTYQWIWHRRGASRAVAGVKRGGNATLAKRRVSWKMVHLNMVRMWGPAAADGKEARGGLSLYGGDLEKAADGAVMSFLECAGGLFARLRHGQRR